MALVPYTITAIERDTADADASGKQVVVGASCSMFIQPSNSVVLLYDDANGSNGSTAKTTNANGQVTVYIEQGEYRLETNGISRFVQVGKAEKNTTAALISSTRTYEIGDIVETVGFSTKGDGGGASWVLTSNTGTASQTPAQLGDALLNDANGNQWELTNKHNPVSYSVGMPTGVDDTVLLEALIKSANSLVQTNRSPLIAQPEMCEVTLLSGSYILTRHVSNNGKVVTFNVDSSVNITGDGFLNGRINKQGLHINAAPSGIRENSQGLSSRCLTTGYSDGNGLDDDGGTFGITDIDQLSTIGAGDSVALTIQNKFGRNLRKITGTTFTANTVTYTGVLNTIEDNITVGSILYGKNSGVLGLIESIDLPSKTITVQKQWYVQTGVNGSVGTPVNGETLIIDFYDKVWGANINVVIDANEEIVNGAGFELGVITLQDVSSNLKDQIQPYMWGYDAVNLEPAKDSSIGFNVRNNWKAGFVSQGPDKGFVTLENANHPSLIGFSHESGAATAFRSLDSNGLVSTIIRNDGTAEWGAGDVNITHDYKTLNADYDVRFSYIGGNALTSGLGTLQIKAVLVDTLGAVQATAYRVAGTRVVTSQQPAISNSVGGDESAKINEILATLRAHGLIAT